MKSKVYFSRTITPEKVLELYKMADHPLTGNVAIKLHSGETGNQNFLKPAFWKTVIEHVGGIVAECNTAYEGTRNNQLEDRERGRAHTIFVELQGGQQGSGDTLNQDARVGALTSSSHGEKGRKKYLQRSMML